MLLASEATLPARTGDSFIRTHTGRKFWPLNPRPEEVEIEVIAHSLSLVNRWTGHTYCAYSVAEHSLRVSALAEDMAWERHDPVYSREVALWGLLHDASEAYLCDVPTPLKRIAGFGDLYKGFERNLMGVIAERFSLSIPEPPEVKAADRILLNTEGRDLMDVPPADAAEWRIDGETLADPIFPVDCQRAEADFLKRFHDLMSGRRRP